MRKLIAAAWIAGSAASALALTVFLFGCCVLPFHHVIHHAFPICSHVAGVLSGGHHQHDQKATTPTKRVTVVVSGAVSVTRSRVLVIPLKPQIARNERNVRTLGSLRVDDDVGLHALLATFLI